MFAPRQMRIEAVTLFVAPVVLLTGLVAHPFVSNYLDTSTVARAVSVAPVRWAWAHVIITVGLGLVVVAAGVIRHRLRRADEQRWSLAAMPPLLVGGMLLAGIAGSDIHLASVAISGQDVRAVVEAGETFLAPLYLGGAVAFATGLICLTTALHHARILSPLSRRLASAAWAVVAIALFVPQTSSTYVYGAALVVANWVFGYALLADRSPSSAAVPPPAAEPI